MSYCVAIVGLSKDSHSKAEIRRQSEPVFTAKLAPEVFDPGAGNQGLLSTFLTVPDCFPHCDTASEPAAWQPVNRSKWLGSAEALHIIHGDHTFTHVTPACFRPGSRPFAFEKMKTMDSGSSPAGMTT